MTEALHCRSREMERAVVCGSLPLPWPCAGTPRRCALTVEVPAQGRDIGDWR
jgi:hypothetical protein